MRQIVVVATDTAINVFTDEAGTTTQIATIVNPGGLEVPDLVSLGGGLIDALHLNGAVQPAPVPRVLPPAPRRTDHSRKASPKAPSIDDIIEFIRTHSDASSVELARALVPVPLGNTRPVQTINNRLARYYAMTQNPVIQRQGGGSGQPSRHFYIGA